MMKLQLTQLQSIWILATIKHCRAKNWDGPFEFSLLRTGSWAQQNETLRVCSEMCSRQRNNYCDVHLFNFNAIVDIRFASKVKQQGPRPKHPVRVHKCILQFKQKRLNLTLAGTAKKYSLCEQLTMEMKELREKKNANLSLGICEQGKEREEKTSQRNRRWWVIWWKSKWMSSEREKTRTWAGNLWRREREWRKDKP